MKVATKVAVLMFIILSVFSLCVGFTLLQVDSMQYDGKIVNSTGMLRGGGQRLVKLELAGKPADELIPKMDKIAIGLVAGDESLNLPKADDQAFIDKMGILRAKWDGLKKLAVEARGKEEMKATLLQASEEYFTATNDAVAAAELAAAGKVRRNKLILVGFSILIGAVIAIVWWTMRVKITHPLAEITKDLEAIAAGDLTVSVRARSTDEIGHLAQAATRMVQSFRGLLSEAAGASVELASVAEELSATTEHIASSNEEVSVQSHAVASASEEMSVTVSEVARSAQAVNEASSESRRVASEGAAVIAEAGSALQQISATVLQAVETVRALGQQSQQIGVVVEVIQDIADQTNLLALNAAIEAARAGEHGRGFAVVADEVRKLAEKTMRATQEISKTIASIQGENQKAIIAMDEGQQMVLKGKSLGEKAGEAIRAIEDGIATAAEQTQQIAVASAQLTATVRDVTSNIEEISKGVEQNTSAAVEIAHTADSLAKKASQLKGITGRFQTS